MNVVTSVAPVFVKNSYVADPNITPYAMCTALINVIGSSKLEGVQKVNNIRRLYVKDKILVLQIRSTKSNCNKKQYTYFHRDCIVIAF